MLHRLARAFFASVLLTSVVLTGARAGDWVEMLQNPALWPARLAVYVFPTGSTLGPGSPVTFGAWTISVGTQRPAIFRMGSVPEDGTGILVVRSLSCTNAITGEQDCELMLATGGRPAAARSGARCLIQPLARPQGDPRPPSQAPKLDISCPTDLRIE